MLKIEIQQFKGVSVLMTVDGQEALGILNFSSDSAAAITTLCFVTAGAECPLIQYALTDEDIAALKAESPNRLVSKLRLTSGSARLSPFVQSPFSC